MTNTHQLLYLSRAEVEAVGLEMPAIIRLLEEAFREKGAGRVEMPPKPGIHTQPDAFIHAMPAYIPSLRAAPKNSLCSGDGHCRHCSACRCR